MQTRAMYMFGERPQLLLVGVPVEIGLGEQRMRMCTFQLRGQSRRERQPGPGTTAARVPDPLREKATNSP